MNIHISIDAETPEQARSAMHDLLFSLKVPGTLTSIASSGPAILVPTEPITSEQANAIVAAATATRERGKPSPGSARRTKAAPAEDEAADKADADVQVEREITNSPEDRQDPEDAADEAAETEASRDSEKPLTHDDVRAALGKYVKAFGMAAAQEDGPKVIALALGKDHSDAVPAKVSAIPDDQAALTAVIAGIEEMTSKNPFGRKADL